MTKQAMAAVKTALVVSAATLAMGVQAASAEERICRGTLGSIAVDNLRVPQGATCTLQRTRVKGTVKVGRSARLNATGIRVVGNVQAENAASVIVKSSTVGGSIQVVQGRAATVNGNRVTGDVQLFANRGALKVTSNRIDGNLQCKENARRPGGGGNAVAGNKEDQCSRL
jgi:hypothetical protein